MTSPTLRTAQRSRRTWRTRPPSAVGSALRNSTPPSTGSTRKASREPDRRLPRDGVTQPMSGNAFWQRHGDTWARRSEHGLPNAAYDRPAILCLAGDITGRRVLELGCAAGVLTRKLVDRGASVLALEREPRMADLARQRLNGCARVEVADVEQPLDMVPDACIDLV